MSTVNLTWQEFVDEAKHFISLSERLSDNWKLIEKQPDAPNIYLSYKQKIKCDTGAYIAVEYHVIYSISYQVPMLYFQAHRADGSILNLEKAWQVLFTDAARYKRADLLTTLTQMEHPILFRPYFALHPCRTAELLGQFTTAKSHNRILTFISLVGPFVKLNLANEYGKIVEEN